MKLSPNAVLKVHFSHYHDNIEVQGSVCVSEHNKITGLSNAAEGK